MAGSFTAFPDCLRLDEDQQPIPLNCLIVSVNYSFRKPTIIFDNHIGDVGERFMKKSAVRFMSAVLAAAVGLSFAACDKKNGGGITQPQMQNKARAGTKVAEDAPWYNSVKTVITPEIGASKQVPYTSSVLAGADDKNLVIYTSGDAYSTPGVIWMGYRAPNSAVAMLTVLDRATKQVVKTIDLYKDLTDAPIVQSAAYADGKIKVIFEKYDEYTGAPSYVENTIDPSTGAVLDSKTTVPSANCFVERVVYAGSFKVSICLVGKEDQYHMLKIASPDGQEKDVALKVEGKSVWDVNTVIPSGEDKILVPAHTDGDARLLLEVDLRSGQLKALDAKEYEWLDFDHLETAWTGTDGSLYYNTSTGITKADLKNKTAQEVFNFSWCGENREELSTLRVASCSDGSFILCGDVYETYPFRKIDQPPFAIVDFTKADKNPNAGKTILTLYAPNGYVNRKIADVINQFNSTNGEYFIEFTDRYAADEKIDYGNVGSQDESDAIALNSVANLSNKLAMDIMNGEGPDILMNVGGLGQLNNSGYLADLSKYAEGLDKDKYFTNIIEGAKTNGALYQMPLCFGIEGIVTDAKNAGASGVGFTTQEYERFLKETLNGTDVITSGQAMYFTNLFNGMSDKFIADGKADFSGKEFAELAEFVKNNVMEKPKTNNDSDDFFANSTYGAAAYYSNIAGIGNFFMNMTDPGSDTTILGIPSTDGRGPMFTVRVSVAVSAQAVNIDACAEFVKLLMTDDIMHSLSLKDDFVISRAAFRQYAEETVAYFNDPDNTTGANRNPMSPSFSNSNIDKVEKIISTASKMDSEDAAISIILYEEMPAYFLGQKDLASVITIAQDRAQKVLSERA